MMKMEAMEIGAVAPLPRDVEAHMLWLRVVQKDCETNRKRVLVERRLAQAQRTRIPVPKRRTAHVCIEVWRAGDTGGEMMELEGACEIDCAAWMREQPERRWFELRSPAAVACTTGSAYQNEQPHGLGVHIEITEIHPPAMVETEEVLRDNPVAGNGDGISLILPHRPLRARHRLKHLCVPEVVHQRQVTVLRELLNTTLYSKVTAANAQSHCKKGMENAMTLLQLSCQYAMQSNIALENYITNLSTRLSHEERLVHRYRTMSTRLLEKKLNLAQELHVVESALDGMRVMLQELDPELFQRIQGDAV